MKRTYTTCCCLLMWLLLTQQRCNAVDIVDTQSLGSGLLMGFLLLVAVMLLPVIGLIIAAQATDKKPTLQNANAVFLVLTPVSGIVALVQLRMFDVIYLVSNPFCLIYMVLYALAWGLTFYNGTRIPILTFPWKKIGLSVVAVAGIALLSVWINASYQASTCCDENDALYFRSLDNHMIVVPIRKSCLEGTGLYYLNDMPTFFDKRLSEADSSNNQQVADWFSKKCGKSYRILSELAYNYVEELSNYHHYRREWFYLARAKTPEDGEMRATDSTWQHKSPAMVAIKGGEFMIKDQHFGTVSRQQVRAFEMGKYEVTRKEWDVYCINNLAPLSYRAQQPQLPAEKVTWEQALRYCNWLSQEEQLRPCYTFKGQGNVVWDTTANGYRLPTEAEWEYAAYAQHYDHLYAGGSDLYAVASIAKSKNDPFPLPVGSKQANAFGLFDMTGNAGEWLWTDFSSSLTYIKPVGAGIEDVDQYPSKVLEIPYELDRVKTDVSGFRLAKSRF